MGAHFQMFANLHALFGARRFGDGVVKIRGQPGSYSFALHWKSSPAELARSDVLCEETVMRRAAENASEKGAVRGLGCADEFPSLGW